MLKMIQQQVSQQGTTVQLQQDPGFDSTADPSHRKSSVASTGAQGDDAHVDEAPIDRYPVDDIREKTNCELHQSMKNISMKVAVGFALACEPGARWHGSEIHSSYARVRVDEVVPGYDALELDIPGAEGEMTLEEVARGIILWPKKNIVFPGSAPRPHSPPSSHPPPPRPPSPPSSHPPPPSPPLLERDPSTSPSQSSACQPTPPSQL